MSGQNILARARQWAGLSQAELAQRSGTSRPTLSAYEHDRKSPTLATAARILAAAGDELTITPRIQFRQVALDRGRPIDFPTALPRLPLEQALDRRATTTPELVRPWPPLRPARPASTRPGLRDSPARRPPR